MRILNHKKNLKSDKKNKISVDGSGAVSFDSIAFEKTHLDLGTVSKGVESLSRNKSSGKKTNRKAKSRDNNNFKFLDVQEKPVNSLEIEKKHYLLTDEESIEVQQKKDYVYLYNKAIYLLSMREHSEQEIEAKLSAKSERYDLIPAVIDELLENNYLSNDRFTESYVRARREKGFGPTRICIELNRKGIKNSMIEEHINVNSSIWYDHAKRQYEKKYGEEYISDYSAWTKRARFLQSRGFNMDHIHATLPPVEKD